MINREQEKAIRSIVQEMKRVSSTSDLLALVDDLTNIVLPNTPKKYELSIFTEQTGIRINIHEFTKDGTWITLLHTHFHGKPDLEDISRLIKDVDQNNDISWYFDLYENQT